MRLVLFQPDIPQNAGTLMRLAASLGVGLDIIEPCGFVLDDRRLRRAGMDYLAFLDYVRHQSFATFMQQKPPNHRLVALTTRGAAIHTAFEFRDTDLLLLGRESAGLPEDVHSVVDAAVRIPLVPQARSINVATAASIILGEALRQTDGFPKAL